MVTDNHYRWDFIGLSTDTKPTPETSPKVANGSTLYTSDDSKLYVWYKDQWYEKEATGGGGGTTYTAGNNIQISADNVISATDTTYTAGNGIIINNDVIGVDLVLTTGNSRTRVMSQYGTTNAINSIVITGSGAPDAYIPGTVGQLYEDTTNGKLYQCTDASDPYVWTEVGGSYVLTNSQYNNLWENA